MTTHARALQTPRPLLLCDPFTYFTYISGYHTIFYLFTPVAPNMQTACQRHYDLTHLPSIGSKKLANDTTALRIHFASVTPNGLTYTLTLFYPNCFLQSLHMTCKISQSQHRKPRLEQSECRSQTAPNRTASARHLHPPQRPTPDSTTTTVAANASNNPITSPAP